MLIVDRSSVRYLFCAQHGLELTREETVLVQSVLQFSKVKSNFTRPYNNFATAASDATMCTSVPVLAASAANAAASATDAPVYSA